MDNKNELSKQWEEDLPVLGALKKTMPQQVPAGYFNALPTIMLSKVRPTVEEAKTVKMSFMRYAAAAVLIGVVLTAGYFYTIDKSPQPIIYPKNVDIAVMLPYLSDNDLQLYLNTSTAIAGVANSIESNEILEPAEIDLAELSDEDLMQYLNEQNKPIVKKSS